MEELTVLIIKDDPDVYFMPEGVEDIDEMLDFVNENKGKYVKLYKLGCHDCIYPYAIEEYLEYIPVCVNFSNLLSFTTDELYVLSKDDYDERLAQLISENCQDCVNYEDGDDIDSHRHHMCLNGFCPEYRPKYDEDGNEIIYENQE